MDFQNIRAKQNRYRHRIIWMNPSKSSEDTLQTALLAEVSIFSNVGENINTCKTYSASERSRAWVNLHAKEDDMDVNKSLHSKSRSIPFLSLLVLFNLLTTAAYQVVYKILQDTFGEKNSEFLNDMRLVGSSQPHSKTFFQMLIKLYDTAIYVKLYYLFVSSLWSLFGISIKRASS